MIPKSNIFSTTISHQIPVSGYGSYLAGIVPDDIAKACGAFSASVRQTRGVSSIPIEKYATVVRSMETTKGLTQVNGTTEVTEPAMNGEPGYPFNGQTQNNKQKTRSPGLNGSAVPVNLPLVHEGLSLTALGSGPHGTYTMSDFFGCMSGLPYDWKNIRRLILSIETPALRQVYQNLFLAVSWEQATATVQYTTRNELGIDYYTCTGITLTGAGGGYSRAGTSPPGTVTITNGTGATVSGFTIGTKENIDTFGRITEFTFNASGGESTIIPTITIPSPTGPGWPGMNTVCQTYIDDANNLISEIKKQQPRQSADLNKLWDLTGDHLNIEQRAINLAQPVLVPGNVVESNRDNRDSTHSSFPSVFYGFVDSLPAYAKDTDPHMTAQTLEAISDLSTVGGQSIVAKMREARNQERLMSVGINLDNNIPDRLSNSEKISLLANSSPAAGYDPATATYSVNRIPLDNGQATEPGSFAGSPYQNLISPNLNVIYTSGVLLPATLTPAEAIDEVDRCNCDNWL